MWEGTLMYGPLVMATPDITVWDQAEFDLDPELSDIVLKGHTADAGTDGNVYTLTLADKTFYPDYYLTDHSTHYLRLNVLNTGKKAKKGRGVDKTYLEQAIKIARSRPRGPAPRHPPFPGRLHRGRDDAGEPLPVEEHRRPGGEPADQRQPVDV